LTGKSGDAAQCKGCGAGLAAGALYCGECGQQVAAHPKKPLAARLPWIASAVALVAFSILIAVLVQRGSLARVGDDPITGGIGSAGDPGAAGGGSAGMISADELANMSPREAADRLFDRAMRDHEAGGERADFFAQMSIDAYQGMPPADLDADARFHIGLLQLMLGDAAAARAESEALLRDNPRQLYGLLLGGRAAAVDGDVDGEASYLERLRNAIAAGESLDDPVYVPHRSFIESQLSGAGGGA
jgi:hypothetical protein